MKEMRKLVSVFVPYYNDRAFLRDCIESILGQSYETFELVLLDHASTDDSAQIAHSYSDKRIKNISMAKNLGAGGGTLVNEFLKIAEGDFVKLFCADDVMHPDCIRNLVGYMECHPQVDVVFGNVQYINENLKVLKANWFRNRRYFNANDGNFELLTKLEAGKSFLPYIGSFAKREAFADLKLNESFVMLFDLSLWLSMLLTGKNFAFLDKIVASYRIHQNQVSSIKNSEKGYTRTYFESIAYCDIFFCYVKSLDVLRKVCIGSPFEDKLNEEDVELIEFVLAHHFLTGSYDSLRLNAYLRLERMFSDSHLKNKIEMKFSYGIGELRRDYSLIAPVSFKRRAYKKRAENLNIVEIAFLLVRELWNIVSFRDRRKRKKYTL